MLLGIVAVATALAVLVITAEPASGAPSGQSGADCERLELDQDDDTTPGATVDLTFRFAPADCRPGDVRSEITILLPEELTIPSGFDEEDVSIRAGRRYTPEYRPDINRNDDEPQEIVIPGCQAWEDVDNCSEVTQDISRITLRNLRLPDLPAEDDEPYEVSIQWDGGDKLTAKLGVDATLEVDDDELGYGETATFTGIGFTDDFTANLYAERSDGSVDCDAIARSGNKIGSADVDSNHRFTIDVDIATASFSQSGKYQICAVDGAGRHNNTSVRIEITAGLEPVGSSEAAPGEEVDFRIVGGGNLNVTAVSVAGLRCSNPCRWRQSGNTLSVTLPPGLAGTVSVRAEFGDGPSVSAKVTIGDIDLNVRGVGSAGVGLGQRFLIDARNLAGEEVCRVRLGGVRLAFLDGDRIYDDDDCPEVRRGRFTASVVIADADGEIRPDLISKFLASDGTETLEIIDSEGIKATAEVDIALLELELDAGDAELSPGDSITIKGWNFPPDRNYYTPPDIELEINGRRVASIYAESNPWEYDYRIPARFEAGEPVTPVVSIAGYPLRSLTVDLDKIEIASPELVLEPAVVEIGEPFTVTVTGLERYTDGYYIEIDRSLRLEFAGSSRFRSDRSGGFSGNTVIPEDYHRYETERREHRATLRVHDADRNTLPGAFATLTLQQGTYTPPTPTPTPIRPATPTLIPTNTPMPAPPTPTPLLPYPTFSPLLVPLPYTCTCT